MAQEEFRKPLRIDWQISENITSRYATNMVVHQGEHEFVIFFFEINPPLILGSPEERKAQLDEIDSVPAQCVARVVIAPNRLQEFINVLQENLKNFQERQKLLESEHANE